MGKSLTQQTCKAYQQLSALSRTFISPREFSYRLLSSALAATALLKPQSELHAAEFGKQHIPICHLLWKYFIIIMILQHILNSEMLAG